MTPAHTPTRKQAAPAPRRRAPLTRAEVLTAALALSDREGLDALSMRRVGAAVGVEAMSLYKHVRDKDDLLDGVAELVVGEMELPGDGVSWDSSLLAVARELRRVALAHPSAFTLVATRLPATEAGLRPVEVALAALRGTGLDDAAALSAFWMLVSYVTGAILGEIGALASSSPPRFPELPDPVPAGLPTLTALRARIVGCDHAREFEWGLQRLLAEVQELAP